MPNLNDLKNNGNRRNKIIEDVLQEFERLVLELQAWLYTEFYNDYVNTVAEFGKDAAAQNISKSGVWQRYYKKAASVGESIVSGYGRIGEAIKEYFGFFKETADTDTDKAIERILTTLGYDGGKYTRDGFLFNLMNDPGVERRVKAAAINAIRSGKSLKDFQSGIKAIIQGDRAAGKMGIVEAHYYTNAYTTFAEFDRAVSLGMAEKYKLNWAIWSGPRMVSTRDFCAAKKGKVFSRDEIISFDSQKWQGKIPGQSTLLSCGGYNCIDILLWISDEMAQDLKTQNGQNDK